MRILIICLFVIWTTLSMAETTAPISEYNPLIEAIQDDDTKSIQFLISDDASLINQKDGFGRMSLHYAAALGRIEIVKLLSELTSDIDAQDVDGFSPLMRAAQNNFPDIVNFLINANASKTLKNNSGMTYLDYLN